jgi:RNA polymerase sigma-B factor
MEGGGSGAGAPSTALGAVDTLAAGHTGGPGSDLGADLGSGPGSGLGSGPGSGLGSGPAADRLAVVVRDAGPSSVAETLLRELVALPAGDARRAALRREVVESQLPLVHHLTRRFRGRGEPYDDLVQVGTIGLLNAVDRYNPERGSFTGFAVPTILGEIRRHFRDRGWALRVPRRLQDLGRRVSEAREQLTQTLGHSPTVQEIAVHLDADPDLVLEAVDTAGAYATVPLPTAPEEATGGSLGFVDSGLETVENRATLRPLLARLPARERTILAMRFVRGMSQSQIATEVGISQMHVSRLLARSLATMREGLGEDG